MLFFALALSSLLAVEVLDVEMDGSEKKSTGVSKLSEKEKGALQAWIDNYYVRRSEPLSAKMESPESRSSIQENLHNGHYIKLNNGSIWKIRSSDTPITQSWITPVDIIATQSGDSEYPYKLTNSLTGSSVLAQKVSSVPADPPAPVVQPKTQPPGQQTPSKNPQPKSPNNQNMAPNNK